MNDFIWNPWHGCTKYSEGCQHCYVYRRDESIGKNASEVKKNADFNLPVKLKRDGSYKIPDGAHVFLCMTSDFFLDMADEWRPEIWSIVKLRQNIDFTIITKRIVRFSECIPDDWGEGYENVTVCCTVENQKECDTRLPVFVNAPIKHKMITCEPLLSRIDMRPYLSPKIELLIAGGESGNEARVCDYEWIIDLREQCIATGVAFGFKQTGARFRYKGREYRIERRFQHSQARKANIDYSPSDKK